jgi:hypothetical protein
MNIQKFLVNLRKLFLCVVAYMVGIMLGGMLTAALPLQGLPNKVEVAEAI